MAQEGEKNQSGRRLTRLIVFALAVTVAVLVARPIISSLQTASVSLPKSRLTALIEEKTLRVLGQKAVLDFSGKNGETEPIAAPVSAINLQTQNLLEAVKNLPRDQAEAIKAQLCKELCGECLSTNLNESETNQNESEN